MAELLPRYARFESRARIAPAPPPLRLVAPAAPTPLAPAPTAPALGAPQPAAQISTPGAADLMPLIPAGIGRVPSMFISWASVVSNIPVPPASGGTILYNNGAAPVVLPITPALNQLVTVIDNTGTPGTVVSTADGSFINGNPTFAGFLQPFASFGFIWSGAAWRIV